MSAFQKFKLENSLRVLRTLLGHAKEIQQYAGQQHGHVTIMVQELLTFLHRETLVCILRHPNHNDAEEDDVEAVNFVVMLDRLMTSITDELNQMEGGTNEEAA